jgi:hypothetical protein
MKIFYLLIVLLLLQIEPVNSQATGFFKVANNGSFASITRLSTGEYITVGYDASFILQLVKWSPSFSPIWVKKLSDTHIYNIEPRLIESSNGNYYFMGASTEQSGSALVIKFNGSGNILWQRIYYATGGNLNSYAIARAIGNDDGFVFGGGQCVFTNYVIKCDASGNIEWQKQYYYPLSTGVIVCNSILTEEDSYVVSSGFNINSLLTFRLNNVGAVVSEKAYTYASMQIIPTKIVKLTGTNGYGILGNYNSSNNNKTQFVATLNSDLTLNRFNELTVSTYTQFRLSDIAAVNDGANIVAVGSIYNNNVFYEAILNIQHNGSIVWQKLSEGTTSTTIKNVELQSVVAIDNNYTLTVGAGYNEGAFAAIIDPNGNGFCNTLPFNVTNVSPTLSLQTSAINPVNATAVSAVVNYTITTDVSTTKSLICGALPTAIGDEKSDYDLWLVYPNPASTQLIIKANEDITISKLLITGIDGQLVYSSSFSNHEKINTSSWYKGLYFVELYTNQKRMVKKLVLD